MHFFACAGELNIDIYMIGDSITATKPAEEDSRMGWVQVLPEYLYLDPGESENWPDGLTDDSHLSETGASAICSLLVESLRKQAWESQGCRRNHPLQP